jgi:hypothetical protein
MQNTVSEEKKMMPKLSGQKCTACLFNIRLYLTPLVQARQFIETCGT